MTRSTIDDQLGAALVVRHLAANGYRKIAMPSLTTGLNSVAKREIGDRKAMIEQGPQATRLVIERIKGALKPSISRSRPGSWRGAAPTARPRSKGLRVNLLKLRSPAGPCTQYLTGGTICLRAALGFIPQEVE